MPEGYDEVSPGQYVSPGMQERAKMPSGMGNALDEASADNISRGNYKTAAELESNRRAYSQRMRTTYR